MTEERRVYPRVDCELFAEIERQGSLGLDVCVTNLSLSGFQVSGDERLYEMRTFARSGPLDVHLFLNLNEESLLCTCRVVYQRREGQHRSSAGLTLLHPSEDQLEKLRRFIDRLNSMPAHSVI